MLNGVTTKTTERIPYGAGVYAKGIPYKEDTPPALSEIMAGIMGATQEGGTFTVENEFFAPELDDVQVELEELDNLVKQKARMEVSFAEMTAERLAHMMIAKADTETNEDWDIVTTSEKIEPGHYIEGLCFYGKMINGMPFIILAKKALCTSGFTMNNQSKTNAVMKGTFDFRGNIAYSTAKLPFVIFIRKTSGWETVTPAEAAAAAQTETEQTA